MLRGHEIKELSAFFALGYFEKSTLGPALDRAYQFSVKHRPNGPITARPTAEVRVEGKSEPPDDDLRLFGLVSRKLMRMIPRHVAALAAYYGDLGVGCDTADVPADHPLRRHGRLVSLVSLVPAGKELVKLERSKSSLHLSEVQIIQNAISNASKRPKGTALLADFVAQAKRLQERAEDAYRAAGETSGR